MSREIYRLLGEFMVAVALGPGSIFLLFECMHSDFELVAPWTWILIGLFLCIGIYCLRISDKC